MNSYVLSVCIWIGEFVDQQKAIETRVVDPLSNTSFDPQTTTQYGRHLSRTTINELASFLSKEIQNPLFQEAQIRESSSHQKQSHHHRSFSRSTRLSSLLHRLATSISHPKERQYLQEILVHTLEEINAPDGVNDVVDRIASIVSPIMRSNNGEEEMEQATDATRPLLLRKSVFGIFVRKFLVAFHRLFFDGLAHLYEDIEEYLEEYHQKEEDEEEMISDTKDPWEASISPVALIKNRSILMNMDADANVDIDADNVNIDVDTKLNLHPKKKKDTETQPTFGLSPIPPLTCDTRVLRTGAPIPSSPFSPLSSGPKSTNLKSSSVNPSTLLDASVQSGHSESILDRSSTFAGRQHARLPEWSDEQMSFLLSDMIDRSASGTDPYIKGQFLEKQLQSIARVVSSSSFLSSSSSKRMDVDVLFVKYLHFVRQRQFQGALDCLHQFHDISLARHASISSSSSANGPQDEKTSTTNPHHSTAHEGSGNVQYAALNLAGLYIEFEQYEPATECLQEAIRVAQHHGDHVCVAFALSWLVVVHKAKGRSMQSLEALLDTWTERAKELQLPSLNILMSLIEMECQLRSNRHLDRDTTRSNLINTQIEMNMALLGAYRTPAPRPIHLWQHLHQTAISLQFLAQDADDFSGSTQNHHQNGPMGRIGPMAAMNVTTANIKASGNAGIPWSKSKHVVLQRLWRLEGKNCLSIATVWYCFGQKNLEQVFTRMFLLCYQDYASASDIAIAVGHLALNSQETSSSCCYVKTLRFLADISTRVFIWQEFSFQRTILKLLFEWSMNRHQFLQAKIYEDMLFTLCSSQKNVMAHMEALLCRVQLFHVQGNSSQAIELLEDMEARCESTQETFMLMQILLLKSRILIETRPTCPFDTMPSLLKTLETCEVNGFDLLWIQARLLMARIYLKLKQINVAKQLIDSQMALVLEQGSLQIQGQSYLLLAKCLLFLLSGPQLQVLHANGPLHPQVDEDEDEDIHMDMDCIDPQMNLIVEFLKKSRVCFQSVDDLGHLQQVLYLMACITKNQSIAKEFIEIQQLQAKRIKQTDLKGGHYSSYIDLIHLVQQKNGTKSKGC
jgi:tetratricopeptide (TPR) repeat protein